MNLPVVRRSRVDVRAVAGVFALLSVFLLAGIALAGPAGAHTVLVGSSPTDGVRLDTSPASVRLTFDEEVQLVPDADEVISATGQRVDTGPARLSADGTTITMALRPDLPRGSYSATWRVVSADTHIVSGSISFGVGVDPSAAAPVIPDHTGALAVAANVAQGLVYAGVVLLVGLWAACRLLWGWALATRRVRLLSWGGWVLLLVGTAVTLLVQGPRAANQSWGAVARFTDLDQTVGSVFGAELIARCVLLVVAVPVLVVGGRVARSRPGAALTALLGLAIVVSVAVTGHEAVGTAVALALPSAVLHILAMSLWFGGLTALAVVVLPAFRRGDPAAGVDSLRRWSYTAYSCVACLVLTGEYQAARQISPVQALWSTRYGVILLIKVVVVGLVVAAANLAQRHVLAAHTSAVLVRAKGGEPAPELATAARMIGRSVRIEMALAVVVLAVTAVLVSEPPADTTYGPATTLSAPLGTDSVSVHVDTTLRGPERFDLRVLDSAGSPVAAQTITATLSSASIASLAVRMVRDPADGSSWHSTAGVVPLPGPWTLTLTVALDSTDAYATAMHYQVW